MNSSIIWRIVWKDYRTYRPVWIVLFGISLILQALLVVICLWNGDLVMLKSSPIVMALGMPVVFAIAVSSVAFSQEHEVGTFGYLQSLPIGPFDLFIARTLHAVIGTLAMFCMLSILLPLLVAMASTGVALSESVRMIAVLGVIYAGISIMSIGIGTFFSLLTKHPLRAALSTAIVVGLVQLFGSIQTSTVHVLLPVLIAVVLLSIDILIARRWLFSSGVARYSGVLERSLAGDAQGAIFRSATGRLVWAHLRRLGAIYLGMVGVVLLFWADADSPLFFFAQVFAGAVGVSVFYVDQRDDAYRFYAAHGISPRLVWASRHVVGLLLLSFLCVSVHVAAIRMGEPDGPSVLALTLMPLLAYGCGQLVMLLTRSSLIAIFVSFTLSLLFGAWCWVAFWLQIPWGLAVLPLPIALLLASWLRMPDWVLEKDTVRQMALPLGVTAAGVMVTVISVAVYRVVELPTVPTRRLAAVMTEPTRPDSSQQAAEKHLLQATDRVGHPIATSLLSGQWALNDLEADDEKRSWTAPELSQHASEWLAAPGNQAALASVEAAFVETDRPRLPAEDGSFGFAVRAELYSLTHLIILQARHLQLQGELDAAWQVYRQAIEVAIQMRQVGGLAEWSSSWMTESLVYDHLIWWASSEGQTPERIQGAITNLAKLADQYPDCTEGFVRQHQAKTRVIDEAPDSLMQFGWPSDQIQTASVVYRLMPWERARSRRALRFHDSGELEGLREYMLAVESGWPVGAILRTQSLRQPDRMIQRSLLVPELMTAAYKFSQIDASIRNRHRVAILQLTLIAWKKQHGHYPESLMDAEQDLDVDLDDVFTGQQMAYFPNGTDVRIFVNVDGHSVEYPEDRPFLWSPGLNLTLQPGADPTVHASYKLWMSVNTNRTRAIQRLGNTSSEELVWRSGVLYGLP